MKIFLSYPSVQRPLADRLALALEAEGHDVFIDRTDLKAGEAFHQRLREAIQAADAFVFLITPESVAPGSYALAELNIAQQQWRRPHGRVLPVMVAATPIAALPAYLAAVTVLQPRGETVAEVVAAVAALAPGERSRGKTFAVGVLVAALLLGVAGWYVGARRSAEALDVARAASAADAASRRASAEQADVLKARSARQLCDDGSHEAAYAQLDDAVAAGSAPARLAREDCAMRWLREMRAVGGKQTFAEQVARVQPALVDALAPARGVRAADLRAHLGWGDYLRAREGAPGADPVAHWRRALADDAANGYAQAMWAREWLNRSEGLAEAKSHFAKAVENGRARASTEPDLLPFVRRLQFGGSLSRSAELAAYAVTVADDMRRAGEPAVSSATRRSLWSHAFGLRLFDTTDRNAVLAALPPAELTATFDWLFPTDQVTDDQRPVWRFATALLQANAGDTDAARRGFDALLRELRAAKDTGRLRDEVERGLKRLPAAGGGLAVKAGR